MPSARDGVSVICSSCTSVRATCSWHIKNGQYMRSVGDIFRLELYRDRLLSILETGVRRYGVGQGTLRARTAVSKITGSASSPSYAVRTGQGFPIHGLAPSCYRVCARGSTIN